jgi:hypothetical protein
MLADVVVFFRLGIQNIGFPISTGSEEKLTNVAVIFV